MNVYIIYNYVNIIHIFDYGCLMYTASNTNLYV